MTRSLTCICLIFLSFLTLSSTIVRADELTYDIRGIEDPMLSNVRNHVDAFRLTFDTERPKDRVAKLVEDAEERARAALRPFGYYAPTITSELKSTSSAGEVLRLQIAPGPPVIVAQLDVRVEGEGSRYGPLKQWQASWPLPVGAVLDQGLWEQHKRDAIETATAQGFLQATFVEQSINLDLISNKAGLVLVLDTGQRSMMGTITYDQDVLKPRVLENIPRFDKGEPYTAYLMEKFRTDLWLTGHFTDVEVLEKQRTDVEPPVVDLQVNLKTETRNTYQGSLGFGSDSGVRLQGRWSRHPVTSSGDRVDTAIGWRERENEFLLRTNYRIPRRVAKRQYWVSELTLKTEQQEFDFRLDPEDKDKIRLAKGRINDFALRGGRLQVRNLKSSGDQAFETWYAQYLHEVSNLDLLPDVPPEFITLVQDPDFNRRLKRDSHTLALGIDWDRPAVRGKGFQTAGRRDRAWAFASDAILGSDIDFAQLYMSTSRVYLAGDRWKFLLRGEAGYTDADVDHYTVIVGGQTYDLDITQLPDLYRFRAGGSKSVRGYGFEELSDLDLGSNNIFTASAEVEYRFLDSWSAALFFDIGNAFNDWSKPGLKRGAGIGIRWYTIAGAVRVDVAQALDFEDKPWRLHFTIGTPLL